MISPLRLYLFLDFQLFLFCQFIKFFLTSLYRVVLKSFRLRMRQIYKLLIVKVEYLS